MTSPSSPPRADSALDGPVAADGHQPPVDRLDDGFGDLLSNYLNLQHKLETLPVIEQAKGLLIGRYGVDADTAFCLLQRWSSCTNVKLRRISQLLIDTASATESGATLEELITALDRSQLPPAPVLLDDR